MAESRGRPRQLELHERLRGFANGAWGTLCGALDGARLDAVCARLSSSARERIAYAPGDLLGITLEKERPIF